MPKIALTTFYTQNYQPLADITVKEMRKYCDRHGYYLNERIIGDEQSFHFVKTEDTRKLLDEFEIVMAIEADCLITNHNITVESFLDNENELLYTTDRNGANFGVYIASSSEWTKQLFDWINMQKDKYGDEQNIVEQNPNITKVARVQHPCFNSVPYQHYYPSLGVIGYKDGDIVTMPTRFEGNWENGDFIMHLAGHTLEARCEIFKQHLTDIIYE